MIKEKTRTIRILLAEDHVLVRESLREYLEKDPDLEVVGEAGDGEQMVALAEELQPDIIVADVSMPKVNGIEATKRIKEKNINIPILILTAYDADQYIFSLLEAGAAGYLLKDISGKELIDSIRRVSKGDSVLHPTVVHKVMERFRNTGKNQGAQYYGLFTDREIEALELAARGKTNKEIADKLGVSIRTVEAHLGHIFEKLNVSSRTEAVILALKKGWICLD
ncbi:MAG: DNA-binding response regulator [Candidatus Aquicultor primus]|uniref:DNA-binding response regulator n=1 Tax=Candidatus Aquicultor primus TaxID=1797195 RepID=A0A1F2UQM3_9ACTN|nr:response regulator transcription factor [Candidatus Aquicultor sp.]OFW32943.1 MAG: DNA-binding response regulator [Candidatus Aquicultor primus]